MFQRRFTGASVKLCFSFPSPFAQLLDSDHFSSPILSFHVLAFRSSRTDFCPNPSSFLWTRPLAARVHVTRLVWQPCSHVCWSIVADWYADSRVWRPLLQLSQAGSANSIREQKENGLEHRRYNHASRARCTLFQLARSHQNRFVYPPVDSPCLFLLLWLCWP